MTHSSFKHKPVSTVVFNPEKLTKNIQKSHSRAVAIIEIVEQLITQADSPISDAHQAFRRNQPHQASHMLHTLKGSIGNIGGMRVVEIIHALGNQLDKTKLNNNVIEELFNSMNREYTLFLIEANKWLKLQRSQLASEDELKVAAAQAQVVQLRRYLETNNLKACDVFQGLQNRLQSSLTTEDYQHLNSSINQLEFDKALVCIQTL